MVAAEKGVADSSGMTLDCQYFSRSLVLLGGCVVRLHCLEMLSTQSTVFLPDKFIEKVCMLGLNSIWVSACRTPYQKAK